MGTMSEATNEPLSRLHITAEKKTRRRSGSRLMLVIVGLFLLIAALVFMTTRKGDREPIPEKRAPGTLVAGVAAAAAETTAIASTPATPAKSGEPVLTVSGYVIPRERIEIS